MSNMDNLALAWRLAKQREEEAREQRIHIERQILFEHPAKEEGAETFATETGAKVTLTGKLTYRTNVDQLVSITRNWPAELRPTKVVTSADESKLKAIRRDAPALWAQIAPAITVEPAKTNVSIKFPEV